jgi:hypothetical protein
MGTEKGGGGGPGARLKLKIQPRVLDLLLMYLGIRVPGSSQ